MLLATLSVVLEASVLVAHQRVTVMWVVTLWETAVKISMTSALEVQMYNIELSTQLRNKSNTHVKYSCQYAIGTSYHHL